MVSRIIFLFFILPISIPAFTQEIDMEKKVISIEELIDSTVTVGSFLDLNITHTPFSITVITSEQIQLSGARHLSELLEIYVPGFQYMYNKWNGVIWGMRGVAADRNTKFIFLVNGHKMNHESRDGAFSELDLGFLSDLEKVEVLRGPAGLAYGSGSIAGAINLVTRKYTQDKKIIETAAETWGMRTFGGSAKFTYARKSENNSTLQFYTGFRYSQGSGMEIPHIYGRPSWPYQQSHPDPPRDAPPAVGSSWDTPGNFIISSEYQVKNWVAYARITHQVTNAAGFFVIDPWPDVPGVPDSAATPRMVDGILVNQNGFFGNTESWGNSRRQYKVDNISFQLSKIKKLGKNQFRFNSGLDLVSNKITIRQLPSYTNSLGEEREYEEAETFGEKRINLTGTYIINRRKFNIATGLDSRLFLFGKDLAGRNAQQEKEQHPIIDNVIYFNHAVFSEGVFYLSPSLMLDAGLRYDLHSRTFRHGGFLNSRLGMVYTVNENSNLKLVWQSSGNNGSADIYEHNRNSFNDQGEPYQVPHYEVPTVKPNENSTPIEPVTTEELRALKPEKAYSVEASGFVRKNKVKGEASVSYNTIKDLFTWNQASFRVINAGKYHFVNGEGEIQYTSGKITISASHVISKIVNTNVLNENTTITRLVFSDTAYETRQINGRNYYFPVTLKNSAGGDSTTTETLYPVRDGISVDGRNFLNLASNITKLQADYSPTPFVALHTDLRLFWGLRGRRDLHNFRPGQTGVLEDYATDYQYNALYPYIGVDRKLMVKWNAGISIDFRNFRLQLFVYDILSSQSDKKNVNSIRWQQMANSRVHTDLYGVDFRSYSLKLTIPF